MARRYVAISGSPSATSRSALLADTLLERLPDGCERTHLHLSTLDPAALMTADWRDPGIAAAVEAVSQAHGVILVTPVYKAAYSGVLKCFLDLLDQFAFAGKAVLPLATGGSLAHALAIDYGLRPVLQSMGARHVVQGVMVLSDHLETTPAKSLVISEQAERLLAPAMKHFLAAGSDDPALSLMGHPDPTRLHPPADPVLKESMPAAMRF